MRVPNVEYTVLTHRFGDGWDVFVLDPTQGLIGSTSAPTFSDVEHAARVLLGTHLGRPGPARDVRLNVIQHR